MGVVRDVTIDQLTQAVQGISTTGISDSTGQAINNTLGTLGKDTSLQGIITAINALGTLLGSDKANISGDNIADPATFRNNIGLGWTLISEFTATTQRINHNVDNYNTIAIVGYFTSGTGSTYVVDSLIASKTDLIDKHPIVCLNDGTIRKGQLEFKSTYAVCETFNNLTVIKVFGVN